jgi:hypothetical protein
MPFFSSVGRSRLFFSGSVPPQRQHTDFMNEIAAFIRVHRHKLTTQDTDYDPRHFSTPLLSAHLQALYLRTCPYAEWKTNPDAGFVATATTSLIPDICRPQIGKDITPVTWLRVLRATHHNWSVQFGTKNGGRPRSLTYLPALVLVGRIVQGPKIWSIVYIDIADCRIALKSIRSGGGSNARIVCAYCACWNHLLGRMLPWDSKG